MTELSFLENAALGEKRLAFKHKSGLTVYLTPKSFITDYAVLSVKYGALDRAFTFEGKTYVPPAGVAHFLEHQLFTMPDGTDAFAAFAEVGANANAYTSYSRTSYLFTCTSHFEESLDILLRMVTTPTFTEEGVAREKEIIKQEILAGEDHPSSCLYRSTVGGLFENHPVKDGICGTVSSIGEITPDWLYLCHRAFYTPENMVLSLSGKMSSDTVSAVLDRVLATKEYAPSATRSLPMEERGPVLRQREELYMSVAKPIMEIGIKDREYPLDAIAMARRHILANIALNALFGPASDFAEEMQEKGLLHDSFSSDYADEAGCAYLLLAAETADPEAVFSRAVEIMQDAVASPPSEADFERLRTCAYADYVRLFDSTEEIAEETLDDFFTGVPLLSVADTILDLAYEEWLSFIRSVFQRDLCTISIVYPEEYKKQKGSTL